jgi:stage III sporulation protein SpoIIIAA
MYPHVHHVPIVPLVDNPEALFQVLPAKIVDLIAPRLHEIEEFKMRLGCQLAVCINGRYERWDHLVSLDDCETVETALVGFRSDGRAGIPNTVHRISKRPSRYSTTTGLTVRIGRFVTNVAEPLRPWLEQHSSILLAGPPGVGKSTLMRDMIRISSELWGMKGITVDTSGELAGDGDVPHPALGFVDVMPVPDPKVQEQVISAAIKNHNPGIVYVDEIGYNGDAEILARANSKGIKVWATAHGASLKDLARNTDLDAVLGNPNRETNTNRTELTFDVLIIVPKKGVYLVYENLTEALRLYRTGKPPEPLEILLQSLEAA